MLSWQCTAQCSHNINTFLELTSDGPGRATVGLKGWVAEAISPRVKSSRAEARWPEVTEVTG